MYEYVVYPTNIFGLKFEATFGDERDNGDTLYWRRFPEKAFSDLDYNLVTQLMREIKDRTHSILEIGVNRDKTSSCTDILINEKNPNCTYLGVDLDDKSYLDDRANNVYTIQTDSINIEEVNNKLDSIGVDKLDLIHIDGWHSLKMAINDWKYVERLSEKGIVLLHDVTFHPGPYILYDLVDEKLFKKDKYFTEYYYNDFGIAVFQRI
jgi:predicted O-methyltransferase YrrM